MSACTPALVRNPVGIPADNREGLSSLSCDPRLKVDELDGKSFQFDCPALKKFGFSDFELTAMCAASCSRNIFDFPPGDHHVLVSVFYSTGKGRTSSIEPTAIDFETVAGREYRLCLEEGKTAEATPQLRVGDWHVAIAEVVGPDRHRACDPPPDAVVATPPPRASAGAARSR
jgi:hypothetical protein